MAWSVVHTHPQAELWAADNLRRAGYKCYLPMCVVRRQNGQLLIPLFTRYAFINIENGQPWTPARYTPGVANVLMTNGHPQHISSAAVEALQAGEELRRMIPPPEAMWSPGTACKVNAGALQGYDAVVMRAAGERAVVAIMIFGALRQISVSISRLVLR